MDTPEDRDRPEDGEARRSLEEERVRQESEAAAAEAGQIGGEGGAPEDVSEEERPRVESGEGEAEGFEQAEEQLVEHASHGDDPPDPTVMAGETENEDAGTVYGQPDEERVSELDRQTD